MKTHELLERAATDAKEAYEFNKDTKSFMRISRCGYPLVSLLLEDFVFSALPQPAPTKVQTERAANAAKVKRIMAQATGYLFEQAVVDILKEQTDVFVYPQFKLLYKTLAGTADIVVINENKRRVSVVECKALKYNTLKEASTNALLNDTATSYLSQLAVYTEAIKQKYFTEYQVDSCWMVWCKGSASLFKVPLEIDSYALAETAYNRSLKYNEFKLLFEQKKIEDCLELLDLNTLPLTTPFFSSFSASCPAHYSPWCKLLLDSNGEPWQDADDVLRHMLVVSMNLQPPGTSYDYLLYLLQQQTTGA